jgi:peptidoglycan/xylan/chitin deacetylase (PgdA/CDA1 family)
LRVTLTFDNGPWTGVTENVLDTLRERGLHSTFFVVGTQMHKARDLAVRAAAEGHWIGNHTMTHTVTFGDGADPSAEVGAA